MSRDAFDPDRAIAALDAVVARQLALIVAHPDVARLRRAWEAAHFVIRRLDFRENVQLDLLDCTREELLVDHDATYDEPSRGAVWRCLTDAAAVSRPYTIVLATFGAVGGHGDVVLLDGLAAAAEAAHALLVIGGVPAEAQATLRATSRATHVVVCPQWIVPPDDHDVWWPTTGVGADLLVAVAMATSFAHLRHPAVDAIDAPGELPRVGADSLSVARLVSLADQGYTVFGPAAPARVATVALQTFAGSSLVDRVLTSMLVRNLGALARSMPPQKSYSDWQRKLTAWIGQYCADAEVVSPQVRARRPLRRARVQLEALDVGVLLTLTTRWHADIHRDVEATAVIDLALEHPAPAVASPAPPQDHAATRGEIDEAAPLLAPIAGGAGTDVTYDERFEAIRYEIDKLEGLDGDRVYWQQVQVDAEEILEERAKDFRVACYWGAAVVAQRRTPESVVIAVELLRGLVERFWDTMFPAPVRIRARAASLTWWSEQVAAVLRNAPSSGFDGALAAVDEADAVFAAAFGAAYPGLSAVRSQLRRLVDHG